MSLRAAEVGGLRTFGTARLGLEQWARSDGGGRLGEDLRGELACRGGADAALLDHFLSGWLCGRV